MPAERIHFCKWCGRIATCHDKKGAFSCRVHKPLLAPSLHETARGYDEIREVGDRDRFKRDARDLAGR